MDLGFRWKILGLQDRGSAQNFDTHLMSIVVWPGVAFFQTTKSKRRDNFSKVGMSATSITYGVSSFPKTNTGGFGWPLT